MRQKRAAKAKITRLDIPYDRQDRAAVALFTTGFTASEIAALLRRSEPMVLDVLRKALRK